MKSSISKQSGFSGDCPINPASVPRRFPSPFYLGYDSSYEYFAHAGFHMPRLKRLCKTEITKIAYFVTVCNSAATQLKPCAAAQIES